MKAKKNIKYLIVLVVIISVWLFLNLKEDYSETPIKAIEKVKNEVGFILHEIEVDDGKVLLYSTDTGEDSQVLNAEYVKKSWLGWKWGYGGVHSFPRYSEHTIDMSIDPISYMYFPSTKGTPVGDTPFPMFVGVLNNPDIDSISLLSHLTGEEEIVNIIEGPGYKIWYLFVTKEQGFEFTLKLLSSEGKVLHKEYINEAFLFEFNGKSIRNQGSGGNTTVEISPIEE
ncbi:hypothetical protein [Chengkuizengella sediminis]|uniref:hypothetical protein n=1 Tax=Chengkuizengella sediminis TaxID=1885917 RepID=UPI00138A66A0|nr:hypothetical protein [Chengkuizengella sediminis]NDI35468.1 hypothetical protein [Chengkuizengella sediminis]